MNAEYEKQLETAIDRELKALPELAAPRTLGPRVMRALEARANRPWYRQSWQMWPQALQTASLAVLLALFAGLCFGGFEFSHARSVAAEAHKLNGWFAGVNVLWSSLNAVLGALVLVVKHLGTGFMIGCLVAVGFGYALCMGIGTVYVRLAFARR